MRKRCPLGPGPRTLLVRKFWLFEHSLEKAPLQLALKNRANQAWALGEALEGPPGMCLYVVGDGGAPAPPMQLLSCLLMPPTILSSVQNFAPAKPLGFCPPA